MKKEILDKLKQDARNDEITLKEILAEEKNTEAAVARFSQKLSERHASDFSGVLMLKYDKISGKIHLYAGDIKKPELVIDKEDILIIPHQVMLLRERRIKE
ncbi:MAG: hypothetical protein QXZ40_01875, partial [Candidatus Micrarchaeia archaeon]